MSRLLPVFAVVLALVLWDRLAAGLPPYILPGPRLVARTLVDDAPLLLPAAGVTALTALAALVLAATGGALLALAFAAARPLERALTPFAVVLQVTPIVAVAPLIFLWVPDKRLGLLLVAWIVAFFPVLSNTLLGLRSADHGLHELFTLHGASRWQRLRLLQVPAALPYFLAGVRVAGGLALIGAVVAEYVAGTGGVGAGLASRILEAGFRLNVPRMFAGLVLVAALGVAVHLATGALQQVALRRWHESARERVR